jgi:transposase
MVAVIYVLTSGCAWRRLPAIFGIAVPTAYRRFVEWTNAGVWDELCGAVDASGAEFSLLTWVNAIREAAKARTTATDTEDRGQDHDS